MPTPRDKELLVRVHATTVNRTDCGVRSARPFIARFFYGLRRPMATVLGNEFAGDIVAAGNGVTSFAVGDRVFGFNAHFGVVVSSAPTPSTWSSPPTARSRPWRRT